MEQEMLRKQLDATILIGNLMNEEFGSVEELLQKALFIIMDMINGKYGTIYLVEHNDLNEKILVLKSGIGIPEELVDRFESRPISPNFPSVVGESAHHNKTLMRQNFVDNIKVERLKKSFKEFKITDLITCPMSIKGEVIGVVQFTRGDNIHFSPSERDLLETFSNQLAVTMKEIEFRNKLMIAKDNSDFFIDLLCHDISNQNMMAYACMEDLEIFMSSIEDENTQFFFKGLKNSLKKTQSLIDKVRTLTRSIDLDGDEFSDIDILFSLRECTERILEQYKDSGVKIKYNEHDKKFITRGHYLMGDLFFQIFSIYLKVDKENIITIESKINDKTCDIFINSSVSLEVDELLKIAERLPFRRFNLASSDKHNLHNQIIRILLLKFNGRISIPDTKEETKHDLVITFSKPEKKEYTEFKE